MLFVLLVNTFFFFAKQHIKKRGNNFLAYPAHEALALPLVQNKQCRSPRVMDTVRPPYTKPMDEEHCVIAVPKRICEIHEPQIIRRYNVFLICPAAPCGRRISPLPARVPVALEWGSGGVETTVQKYKLFPTWQKKMQAQLKRACTDADKMAVTECLPIQKSV